MSANEIGVFEAKTQLSRLIEQVQATGQSVLITRHGKPVAALCAVGADSPKRARGCGSGADYYMAPDFDAPLEDFESYMPGDAEMAAKRGLRAAEMPPPNS